MPPKSLSPRKNPTQPRAIETVAVMLEAAAQILEQLGSEAFNTNAVAGRAGVSIGSLYQYFPGKDALLIALMQREKERFHRDAASALAAPTAREAMDHLLAAAVRQQFARPELARLLDIAEKQPEAQREVDRVTGCREVVRALLDRPDLPRQPDLEAAADDLMSLIQALVDAAGSRRDGDLAVLTRRVRAVVWAYLCAVEM